MLRFLTFNFYKNCSIFCKKLIYKTIPDIKISMMASGAT